jgi:hypothetical protein
MRRRRNVFYFYFRFVQNLQRMEERDRGSPVVQQCSALNATTHEHHTRSCHHSILLLQTHSHLESHPSEESWFLGVCWVSFPTHAALNAPNSWFWVPPNRSLGNAQTKTLGFGSLLTSHLECTNKNSWFG